MYIDNGACKIESVGTFIDQDRIWIVVDDCTQRTQSTMVIHRRVIVLQPRRHALDVRVFLILDLGDPLARWSGPILAYASEQRLNARSYITNHGRRDFDVTVHFLGLNVDLHEFLRFCAPLLALAVRQEPI